MLHSISYFHYMFAQGNYNYRLQITDYPVNEHPVREYTQLLVYQSIHCCGYCAYPHAEVSSPDVGRSSDLLGWLLCQTLEWHDG